MDTRNRLAVWLADSKKDFHQGVSLFKELDINSEMLPFLRTGKPHKLHWSILIRHMEEYARIHQIKPAASRLIPVASVKERPVVPEITKLVKTNKPAVQSYIQRPKIDKNPAVRYEELPVELQVLFDENGRLNNESKAFHAKLKVLKDSLYPEVKEERGLIAREILSRKSKIRENWDRIDSWWKNRKIDEDPIEKAKREVLEKEKRIKANLNYIRRYYGNEKNADEVVLRMQELDKWNISYEKLIRKV